MQIVASRFDAADVQVLLDGSDSNTANIALGYVTAILLTHSSAIQAQAQSRRLGRAINPPVEARPRVLYNHTLESKNFIVPGLIAVILMIIASLLTSLTIAREWEMGTMEQVLSTPLRPAEIVVGKMLAYFAIVIAYTCGMLLFICPVCAIRDTCPGGKASDRLRLSLRHPSQSGR